MIRSLTLAAALLFAVPALAQNTAYEKFPIPGGGCGTAQMDVSFEDIGSGSKKLVLEASNFFPQEFGVLTFGLQTTQFNILNCPVYTIGIWGHTFQTDPTGYHKWERAWPQNVYAWFRIQMGTWRVGPNGFEVMTSNGWIIQHLQP